MQPEPSPKFRLGLFYTRYFLFNLTVNKNDALLLFSFPWNENAPGMKIMKWNIPGVYEK